jgi:ferritin-like metal-binding protein YciE
MDRGIDFLRSQVNNAVVAHRSFIENLKTHAAETTEPRLRELCEKHIPAMAQHQAMLEQYQSSIGAGEGLLKKTVGGVFETAREWSDAVTGDDYLRLVGDVVMGRQMEDTFKTFREGGRRLGDQALERLGEIGEAGHDEYVREANRLVQMLFVEHVQVPAAARR